MAIKNFICDWSGFISNDHYEVYKVVMLVFDEVGAPRITFEQFKREFSLPYGHFYRSHTGVAIEEIQKLYKRKAHLIRPKIFPDMRDVIRLFREEGKKLAVLSSHPRENLVREAIEYKIFDCFEEIRGWVVDKRKDLKVLVQDLEFQPSETAYIGDMVHDIEAGRSAGLTTVAVTWGYDPVEKLAPAKPDFLIYKPRKLVYLL